MLRLTISFFVFSILLFVLTFVVYNNPSNECDYYFNEKIKITIYAKSEANRIVNQFNLTQPFEKILNKCNIQDFHLTFYELEIDAKLETNRLVKFQNYQTTISKKIFVRLDNKDLGFIQIIDLNIKSI
tara:strand:+ start:641 stop:1024 length:384 start_codon:yes stop_codon:yes gene_type:complete